MTQEPTIQQMNEVIALFDEWQIVDVGYTYGPTETEWQRQNIEWMDKVGLNIVGRYYVNVNEDKFVEYQKLKYHSDCNLLMRIWYKFIKLRFSNPMHQLKHSELKTTIGHAIRKYRNSAQTYL